MQHQRPRLHGSVSGASSGNGSNGSTTSLGNSSSASPAPNPGSVTFYNIHQPSARSPLSQESTPFGLFRHKNLSTSALPNAQSPATGSSSNLVLAPVTSASASAFSPNSSYTNLLEAFNTSQKDTDSAYSPSTPVLPPLPPPVAKLSTTSPKISGRPTSFQTPVQYFAWWDYIARDHDELSFKRGDILIANREFDDLWCYGSVLRPDKRTSARHGFFPLQFCSLDNQCYIPSSKIAARTGTVPGTEPGCRLNIVHPYSASAPDELNLMPGNQVRLIHIFDDGWILGEQIDHSGVVFSVGVFPAGVAKPTTAAMLESPSGGVTGATGNTSMSSPSKQRHGGSPLAPGQDNGLVKTRPREESFSSTTSGLTTLYSHQNSSSHLLQYSTHNGSATNLTASSNSKLPGSPTASPYITGQQIYRASPPIIPTRPPHGGMDSLRANTHQNRTSVQSTTSSTDGRRGTISSSNPTPIVTEDQVVKALVDRPVQDALLEHYLNQQGDPNIVDEKGNSLLHLAIVAHSQASLVFLLNAPSIRLEHGSPVSPLYTAVRFRSWKAAQQLLIHGANPNAHDDRGLSVLHIVLLFMTKGDTLAEGVVQLLCESKADVNCVSVDKKIIPLATAVERELWAEAEILLAYGANPYLIWNRDRRQSLGTGQPDPLLPTNGILTTGYFNDPLWEAVHEDKVHLVRLLLKFYYAPTSFMTTPAPPPPPPPPPAPSSPSPSPSSTQSSQSFFGPQPPFLHHSSASSYTTNNGSSGNINIPNIPHGASVPMPFAGNGTLPSIPSPSSAQSSPGSAALVGYMAHRTNTIDSVGSPKLTPLQGSHVSSFSNASANPNMVGGANSIYVITPKVLLQALTLAKDLGHHDCFQVLSRPEIMLKEGTLYGTGSYGYNQLLGNGNGGPNHGNGTNGGAHASGKEHRNLIQKLTSLFK
ncbi:hypothetical protein BGX31_004957 [Mortierella sp. GBA43]|nr:hypothetical protein BGX31_004957 [Mortierella sp. GBA43]